MGYLNSKKHKGIEVWNTRNKFLSKALNARNEAIWQTFISELVRSMI